LPPGAEVAVIAGNRQSDGPYVVRVRIPAKYKVMPHTHPTDENVTVISGTMNFAMGPTFDAAKGQAVPAGGFFLAPKGMQHYAWSSEPSVIQIHGMGPFAINYVNPADDPSQQHGREIIRRRHHDRQHISSRPAMLRARRRRIQQA